MAKKTKKVDPRQQYIDLVMEGAQVAYESWAQGTYDRECEAVSAMPDAKEVPEPKQWERLSYGEKSLWYTLAAQTMQVVAQHVLTLEDKLEADLRHLDDGLDLETSEAMPKPKKRGRR